VRDGRSRSILIVSGRRLIAEALADFLRRGAGVERCAVAGDLDQVRHAARASPPSTFVVDLDCPGCDTGPLTGVVEARPGARRVGVYDTFTTSNAQRAYELGLTVLLPLTSPVDHVVELVLGGQRDSLATRAVGITPDQLARLNSLTPRELEVLHHVAQGHTVRSVAALLGVTAHTVDTHKRRCFAKLGVQQQTAAVALAVSAGMISPR